MCGVTITADSILPAEYSSSQSPPSDACPVSSDTGRHVGTGQRVQRFEQLFARRTTSQIASVEQEIRVAVERVGPVADRAGVVGKIVRGQPRISQLDAPSVPWDTKCTASRSACSARTVAICSRPSRFGSSWITSTSRSSRSSARPPVSCS